MVINSEEDTALLAAAVPVHIAISLWWAIVLARLLPLRRRLLAGGLIGAAIAVLDPASSAGRSRAYFGFR